MLCTQIGQPAQLDVCRSDADATGGLHLEPDPYHLHSIELRHRVMNPAHEGEEVPMMAMGNPRDIRAVVKT